MSEHVIRHIPTETALNYWAGDGDVEQVSAILQEVQSGNASEELATRLESLEARMGVLRAFKGANNRLTELHEDRPAALFPEIPVTDLMVETLPLESARYRRGIRHYIEDMREDVSGVFRPSRTGMITLTNIEAALADEAAQKATMAKLENLSDVPKEWIMHRSMLTVAAVKENLWEVAVTGRETGALVRMPDATDADRQRYFNDWRATDREGFGHSRQELGQAINWLESDA